MVYKLDKLDNKIIDELSVDSRRSLEKIAKTLKISKQMLNYRLKNLYKKKIITQFTTWVDSSVFGSSLGFGLYIKLDHIPTDFIEKIKKIKNIHTIVESSGSYDLYISIFCDNSITAKNLIEKIKNLAKGHITKLSSFCHAGYRYKYLNIKQRTISPERIKLLDAKDIIILKELMKNSRISLKELGKKIDLNFKTVGIRIRKLELNKIIRRYTINFDHSKIYDHIYSIMIKDVNVNDEKIKELFKRTESFEFVSTNSFVNALVVSFSSNNKETVHRLHRIISEMFPEATDVQSSIIIRFIKRDWSGLLE
ncbi:Lrp/AsnC family transcriptional regulator [Nanoarchaeota archaeon]